METDKISDLSDQVLNQMAAELYTVLPKMSIAEFSQYAILKEHMRRRELPPIETDPMEAADRELHEASIELNLANHRYNQAILSRIELRTQLNKENR